ncbi:MAG: hypothetical protein WCF36_19795 [Candidatus Nanopelagicales bacterium]
MNDDATRQRVEAPTSTADRRQTMIVWAASSGVILALVGFVNGSILALSRTVVPCPDDTFFPPDATNFDCYVHPQAGVGVAIATLSLQLGIVIVLGSAMASASLKDRRSI